MARNRKLVEPRTKWKADPRVIKHLESVVAKHGDESVSLGFGTFTWREILAKVIWGGGFVKTFHDSLRRSLPAAAR